MTSLKSFLLHNLDNNISFTSQTSSLLYILSLITHLPLELRKAIVTTCRVQSKFYENERLSILFDKITFPDSLRPGFMLDVENMVLHISNVVENPIFNSILLAWTVSEPLIPEDVLEYLKSVNRNWYCFGTIRT
jgi:hypothetical protein